MKGDGVVKVQSPLANMEVVIGRVRRAGNDLVLSSRDDSSMEAVITISAAEAVRTAGAVLSTPSGLGFVLGLPFFWLRQRLGWGVSQDSAQNASLNPANINKPW